MTSLYATLRRVSSITLAMAFIAMASSGLLMFVVDRFGFQVRMHPVHNAFGIVMVAAGLVHAAFNWKTLMTQLRLRWAMALAVLLAGVIALLFMEGLSVPVDADAVRQIDEILSAARRAEHTG